jgi:hypothetical protein
MVTVVGTASAVISGGSPISGGRWSVLTVFRSNLATVVASPWGVTRMMSLPAASAMRALPLRSTVNPYGFDSSGMPSWS